jgi:hypothetical protein
MEYIMLFTVISNIFRWTLGKYVMESNPPPVDPSKPIIENKEAA